MTVDELLSQVNRSIDESGIQVPEGCRAAQYVDLRAFRYYRSQQLVDPPHEKQGVAGLYGDRHMWQLLAIKALQAYWLPLPEIRNRLADASDEKLRGIALQTDGRSNSRPRTPIKKRSPKGPRAWVQVPVTCDAYVMVDQGFLSRAKPSTLRALGVAITTGLLNARE